MRFLVLGCVFVTVLGGCSSDETSSPKGIDNDVKGTGTSGSDATFLDAGTTGGTDNNEDATTGSQGTDSTDTTDGTTAEPDVVVEDAGSADSSTATDDTGDSPDVSVDDTDEPLADVVAADVNEPDTSSMDDAGTSDSGVVADVGMNDTGANDVSSGDAGPKPTPQAAWFKAFGGDGPDEVIGVAADSKGNVYVAGTYSKTITIGTSTFQPADPAASNNESKDSFVASFDPQGAFRWAHAFTAKQADSPFEIDVDGNDNVFVAGSHKDDLTVGTQVLTCAGSSDIYMVSLDSEGVILWAKSWGGATGEVPKDLSVNTVGDIFITGSYQGSITADGIVGQDDDPFGLSEVFVLAVDGKTHEALWITVFGGNGHDVGTAIVSDKARNTVIAVSYQNDLVVDASNNTVFQSGGDNFNCGLIRLDNKGQVLWAQEFGGQGAEEFRGLGLDGNGNIYATGVFSDTASFGGEPLTGGAAHDVVLASYKSDGSHVWSMGYKGAGFDQALDLQVWGNQVYIAGRFTEDLTFGETVLTTAQGEYDVFMGIFSTMNGSPLWAQSVGSAKQEQGSGIGVGGDGGVYVGGYVQGEITFEGQVIPAPGKVTDGFVFRYTN